MIHKIFISFGFALLAIAPTFAAESTSTTPPDLIGGTLLPGVEQEKTIQEDSSEWIQNTFLKNAIDFTIGLTAALAVIFLLIGGYQYLTAVGNEEQIKSAHKTITFALVGLLLALLSFAIVQILVNIQFEKSGANLLAADAADILPFAEKGWSEVDEIKNLPTGDFKEEFLPVVARILIYGMASVAFLIFFFAGAWLVLGWGEEADVKKAKDAIIWAITGLAVAAVSYLVVKGILEIDLSWDGKATTNFDSIQSDWSGDGGINDEIEEGEIDDLWDSWDEGEREENFIPNSDDSVWDGWGGL